MNIDRLLARYGFKKSEAPFSHAAELLDATMRHLESLGAFLEDVDESLWLEALARASKQVPSIGREGLVDPRKSELPLASIDLYMRGIVRWLNELGIHTALCCDGHGELTPYVALLQPPTEKQKNQLACCLPDGLTLRWQRRRFLLESPDRRHTFKLLPDFAERLHQLVEQPELVTRYEAAKFKDRYLLKWLNIPGASGRESKIRHELYRHLRVLADEVYTDPCGNVLATRYCGDGPTVLLSAHMDVYQELDFGREIVEEGTRLMSTSGILGADDRAGIAIALYLLGRVRQTNFRGTLKLAFTVQEEIGLVGARNMDPSFLRDTDAAIVIDRRGRRDIVTSCQGIIPFCDASYGRLFEVAGELAGMDDWNMTEGGSSDAIVFAQQFGIPTVNLSAGYLHEHTDNETLDYVAAYETATLIETVLHHQLIETWTNRLKQANSLLQSM